MPATHSPLRYPGGKSQFAPFVIDLIKANDLCYGHYVEPFAGGAGIAWRLLLEDYVSHVHINDLDPSIYAFWHSVLNRTEELCGKILKCRVTLAEWKRQRKIQRHKKRADLFTLGFSTFFMNRTSRSGILDGGVIGGLSQDGDYTIDCRFNRTDLVHRIQRIAARRSQISLHRLDALEFLKTRLRGLPKTSLVNVDPPYYAKGRELYANHYSAADHAKLSRAVPRINQHWMVTYDDTPETRALYAQYPCYGNELYYSAQVKRVGVELLVLDPGLVVPHALTPQEGRRVRTRTFCRELTGATSPAVA